jgi:hypothetical protein
MAPDPEANPPRVAAPHSLTPYFANRPTSPPLPMFPHRTAREVLTISPFTLTREGEAPAAPGNRHPPDAPARDGFGPRGRVGRVCSRRLSRSFALPEEVTRASPAQSLVTFHAARAGGSADRLTADVPGQRARSLTRSSGAPDEAHGICCRRSSLRASPRRTGRFGMRVAPLSFNRPPERHQRFRGRKNDGSPHRAAPPHTAISSHEV